MKLARLDGMLRFIDSETAGMLTMNLSLRKSISSSSIEGTRFSIDDFFRSEREIEREKTRIRDIQEVTDYRRALLTGFHRLPVGGEIISNLIRDLHRILMDGVRGSDKSLKEFKIRQNAIGRPGGTLETARMVPAPPESVDLLLDNWLKYLNSDDINTVEKAALSYYQFKVMHPFRDGNGRVSRLLMMLILRRDKLLTHPLLHLSGYLDTKRNKYIDMLHRVNKENALDDWLVFISEALREQSESIARTVESLIRYRNALRAAAVDINESRVVYMIFRNPYPHSRDVAKELGVSIPTANKIIGALEDRGVLREINGRSRNRLYLAEDVMELLR